MEQDHRQGEDRDPRIAHQLTNHFLLNCGPRKATSRSQGSHSGWSRFARFR
jgi:hypothetical protein